MRDLVLLACETGVLTTFLSLAELGCETKLFGGPERPATPVDHVTVVDVCGRLFVFGDGIDRLARVIAGHQESEGATLFQGVRHIPWGRIDVISQSRLALTGAVWIASQRGLYWTRANCACWISRRRRGVLATWSVAGNEANENGWSP